MKNSVFIVIAFICFCNCFFYSTYQSASLLEPDQVDVVPIADIQYTRWERLGDGHWFLNMGGQMQFGIREKLNIGGMFLFRYNLPEKGFTSENRSYAEVDFKFPIIRKNLFALDIPVGIDWSYNIAETAIILSPTLLFSYPISNRFDISSSLRVSGYVIITDEYPRVIALASPFLTVNTGIKMPNKNIEIRPSVGICIGEGIAGIAAGLGVRLRVK